MVFHRLLYSPRALSTEELTDFARKVLGDAVEIKPNPNGSITWFEFGREAGFFMNRSPPPSGVGLRNWEVYIGSNRSGHMPGFMEDYPGLQNTLHDMIYIKAARTEQSSSVISFSITVPNRVIDSEFIDFFRMAFFRIGGFKEEISFAGSARVHKLFAGQKLPAATVTLETIQENETRLSVEIDLSQQGVFREDLDYERMCEKYLVVATPASKKQVEPKASKSFTLLKTVTRDVVSAFTKEIPDLFGFSGETNLEEIPGNPPGFRIRSAKNDVLVEVKHYDGLGTVAVELKPEFVTACGLGGKPDTETTDSLSRLLKRSLPAVVPSADGGTLGRNTTFGNGGQIQGPGNRGKRCY